MITCIIVIPQNNMHIGSVEIGSKMQTAGNGATCKEKTN